MKKLVFYGILFLVFLAACTPDSDEGVIDTQAKTLPAGNLTSVTVYLDGNGPSESRAMNKAYAEMGCDYFEVYFLYNDGSTNTIHKARGQWRIGERAGVNGVFRTDAGINYGSAYPSGSPNPGEGYAILLAGKSDKTLMAVGRLAAGSNLIKNQTPSVTFEVAAVKSGVNFIAANSSFQTAAGSSTDTNDPAEVNPGNTVIINEKIGDVDFSAFKLDPNKQTQAKYKFSLDYTGSSLSGSLSTYTNALRVWDPLSHELWMKKHPSYTTPEGGNINIGTLIRLDNVTSVSINNNTTKGVPFVPEVGFSFNTQGTLGGSLFALVFEISVYVLAEPDADWPNNVWYIRPGYGVLKYELDDGRGGMGGAVLIRTGDIPPITSGASHKIVIEHVPNKWRYRYDSTSPRYTLANDPTATRLFDVIGLDVTLWTKTGSAINLWTVNSSPSNHIPNTQLIYKIGNVAVIPGVYRLPGYIYGIVEVTVIYVYNDVPEEAKFYILVSGDYETTSPSVVGSTYLYDYASLGFLNDINSGSEGIMDASAANGTGGLAEAIMTTPKYRMRVIRLMGDIDMVAATVRNNSETLSGRTFSNANLYVIVATGNYTLGRDGYGTTGYQIHVAGDYSGLSAFFFGKWPFENLTGSPNSLNSTSPFTVNAAGSGQAREYNNKMFTDEALAYKGPGGGLYNIKIGPGATLLNGEYLF